MSNPRNIVGTGPYVYQSGASARFADGRVEEEPELVGDEGRRAQGRPAVRGGHQERHERCRAGQLPGREHRPVQQLRTEVGDQGQREDVLRQGSLPPGREHDVALPEHDEEAAERQAVPQGARVLDQHEPDPQQGVPGPRHQGEPDRSAPDLEQVDRPEGRQAVRLLVQQGQGQGDPRRGRLPRHER